MPDFTAAEAATSAGTPAFYVRTYALTITNFWQLRAFGVKTRFELHPRLRRVLGGATHWNMPLAAWYRLLRAAFAGAVVSWCVVQVEALLSSLVPEV